jgi:hypothetical protein
MRDEGGFEDRISVGRGRSRASGAPERRVPMLTLWLVVYYVLASALFMDMGGGPLSPLGMPFTKPCRRRRRCVRGCRRSNAQDCLEPLGRPLRALP